MSSPAPKSPARDQVHMLCLNPSVTFTSCRCLNETEIKEHGTWIETKWRINQIMETVCSGHGSRWKKNWWSRRRQIEIMNLEEIAPLIFNSHRQIKSATMRLPARAQNYKLKEIVQNLQTTKWGLFISTMSNSAASFDALIVVIFSFDRL